MSVIGFLPRFRAAYRALKTLQQRETWSRADIEAYQLERLNAVWGHASQHVPYYRNLTASIGGATRFCSLAEYQAAVPLLHKSQIKNQTQDFLSTEHGPGAWKCTSGSTGVPLRVFWGREAHNEMLRAKYRAYDQWEVDIFDRTVFLWGHFASLTPGLKGQLARVRQPWEDRLRNRLRLSAYDLGRTALRSHLQKIQKFQPAMIYAYSTAAYFLALEAEAIGFKCDSLKAVVLTSEPVAPQLAETVERVFGVPAVTEYGSVEGGLFASTALDRTLRVREDVTFLETLPREDGRFDIVVSVLTNPAFPLLRYAIGDITDAPLQTPDQGFAILGHVGGRNNDYVVSSTGEKIHPVWFLHLFDNRPDIRLWRLQQAADGAVSVQLELKVSGSNFDTTELAGLIQNKLESYPLKFEIVEHIPPIGNGKFRWVVSELASRLASC